MKIKKQFLIAMCMISSIISSAQNKENNPFGLVYQDAISKNVAGKVNIRPVTYKLNGIDISANIYTPSGYEPTKKYPAVVVAHPNGGVRYASDTKTTDESADKMPFDLYREGHYYYNRTHAHPNSTFRYTMSSLLDLVEFDAATNLDLINQPLLMMAGSKADSYYMTESAFNLATGVKEKELFLIPGATHIQTYYVPEYVSQAMDKLNEFFGKYL